MYIGAHESASGGPHKAVERAAQDGCEALQIFTKNNNRWAQRMWTPKEALLFRTTWTAQSMPGDLVSHTSYLINLCSSTDATVTKSIDALADELDRCALLGIPYLVMHPGSHTGQGVETGIARIAENLGVVYAREEKGAWGGVTLLLENTAGQGTNIGHDLSHLEAIFAQVEDPSRLGVCLDTCHAYAAGYAIDERAGYDAFFDEFDARIGLGRIGAFHLNDSKRERGSRVDRHHRIGEGHIGRDTFVWLMRDERFATVSGLLETPQDDGWAEEISMLKGLRS